MSSGSSGDARRRRRLASEIKDSLRELRNQLSLLNHQVGAHVGRRSGLAISDRHQCLPDRVGAQPRISGLLTDRGYRGRSDVPLLRPDVRGQRVLRDGVRHLAGSG